jgi:hypothetical protein
MTGMVGDCRVARASLLAMTVRMTFGNNYFLLTAHRLLITFNYTH